MAEHSQLSNWDRGLMMAVAIMFDVVQAGITYITTIFVVTIPIGIVLNMFIITPFAWLSFYTWFTMKGVRLMSKKKMTSFFGGALFELMPVLNTLPGWSVAVGFTLLFDYAEHNEFLSQAVEHVSAVSSK